MCMCIPSAEKADIVSNFIMSVQRTTMSPVGFGKNRHLNPVTTCFPIISTGHVLLASPKLHRFFFQQAYHVLYSINIQMCFEHCLSIFF